MLSSATATQVSGLSEPRNAHQTAVMALGDAAAFLVAVGTGEQLVHLLARSQQWRSAARISGGCPRVGVVRPL